jgi:hypothetical protein
MLIVTQEKQAMLVVLATVMFKVSSHWFELTWSWSQQQSPTVST